MRRRVTEDTELGGVKLSAGDKTTLWYCSANRDEAKFANPWSFDLTRNPNPHGRVRRRRHTFLPRRQPGTPRDQPWRSRNCTGKCPDFQATEEPARLLSPFIHGIKRLPVAWTPPS